MARFDDEERRRVIDGLRAEIRRLEGIVDRNIVDRVLAQRERDAALERARTAEAVLEDTQRRHEEREELWQRMVG